MKNKNYSIIAGVCLLLYALYSIGEIAYEFISWGDISFIHLIFIISILVLSFMFLIKKKNLVVIISLIVVTLANSYWCISTLPYLFDYPILYDILIFGGYLLTSISPAFLSVMALLSIKEKNNSIKNFWFIPAVLEFLYLIINLGINIYYGIRIYNLGFYILQIVYCIGFAFAGLSFSKNIENSYGLTQNIQNYTDYSNNETNQNTSNYTSSTNSGYYDMAIHVLLLLFLGWIWLYVWIYKTTDYLNKTPNEEKRNPVTKLLLCIFVPFYYIYWVYQSGRRIEILAKEKNIDCDIVAISVVLSIFFGIIPPIIMQSKLNQISKCDNQTIPVSEINKIAKSFDINFDKLTETNSDKTNEIRNYKSLLDDGIITEEEFEAKKKQLLGL